MSERILNESEILERAGRRRVRKYGGGLVLSEKQERVLNWWRRRNCCDGIICDGAVRSGKTWSMSISFVMWASCTFTGHDFAFCGKTITSVKRNLVVPLMRTAKKWGFRVKEYPSKNYLEISLGRRENRFYLFGGRDESSASLIQGMTLAGVLLDEAALMPRSFVEQAAARCSVRGSKLWFNCNPEYREHWFKKEWIDKAEAKRILYLHFDLWDNPSMDKDTLKRYCRFYSGTFYERFVLGRWVSTEGMIYPMFSRERNVCTELPESFEKYAVSCDYGTVNPSSFGLWGLSGGVWYRIREYYYDSRREGRQRTDEEHYIGLERLCGGTEPEQVIVDPSAASFIECIRRHGRYRVTAAKNDVVSGIRRVAGAISTGQIKIHESCGDCIREFGLYRWSENGGADVPVKENDHAMDDVRYFVSTYLKDRAEAFFVAALPRP
ncbi:MAG: PBSX family phage terminase large subunit [Ruminococcus sp.]|nr:PBSX family phage terminase large subunit [Ruminococcus sp.]